MSDSPTPTQPDEVSAFFDAILGGDRNAVRLQAGVDPSLVHALDQRSFGATPITAAARRDDVPMIDLLLELGADIDAKSDWWAGGFGPLHLSRDPRTTETHLHLIERGATIDAHAAARFGMIDRLKDLLDADPALIHERGGDGQFPLHFARDPETAAFLLERGAEIDARDLDHVSTAAEWALGDRPEVTRFLVERGASADEFMLAALGDTDAIRALLASEPDAVERRIGRERFPTPGSEGGHMHLYTIGDQCTMLHAATRHGRLEVMRVLLDAGAELQARGWYDASTPLHMAAWNDQPEAAELLLDRGATVDVRSGAIENDTPLDWAIIKAATATARVLIEGGALVGDVQRGYARRGLDGGFRNLTGIEPARYEPIVALLGTGPG